MRERCKNTNEKTGDRKKYEPLLFLIRDVR